MKTLQTLEERVAKLEEDSHPPVDIVEKVLEAIKSGKGPICDAIKKLALEAVNQDQYDRSPDRWED